MPHKLAAQVAPVPKTPVPSQEFKKFDLHEKLLQSLSRMKFFVPTPIQNATIPMAMKGMDVLGTAQTGTGKTAAFGIPLITHLMNDDTAMAVVMTPTRELAAQVADALVQMVPVPNIRTALLIGGEAIPKQLRQLAGNPRLIVGTPGRINDHLQRRSLKLAKANFLVLDETDRMLDMGFGPQIETVVAEMATPRQTLLFSATLPDGIARLSKKYLVNPQRVAVGSISAPALNIKQETHKVQEDKKYEFLMSELEQRKGSIVIFVKTKHGADRLAAKLAREEHRAAAIHGDLQQRKRDRVIAEFREKRFRILVATDVAARGLDIPHIEHVINYDMPQVPEDYIHRVGRTARAGATGSAVNFVTAADSRKWQAIQKLLGGDTDTQDAKASRGVKRGGGDRARGALPRRAGKPGGGFGGGPGRREAPGGRDSRDSRDSRESTSPRAPRANQPWNPRGEERESPREARSDARPDTRPDARPAPRAGAAPFGKKPARAATGAPKARWGKDRKDAARSAKPAFAGPRSKRRPA